MSAAGVLAVFSWTDVQDAFWLAKLFWHTSLWLSLFALISTAPKRVLDNFPELKETQRGISEDLGKVPEKEIAKILKVLLTRHESNKDLQIPDKRIIWALQSPTMMMSYAWLFFLLGYGLYLITPLLDGGLWTVQKTASHHCCSSWCVKWNLTRKAECCNFDMCWRYYFDKFLPLPISY